MLGTAVIDDTFRALLGNPPPQNPVIPLPAGVWPGMMLLGAAFVKLGHLTARRGRKL